MEILESYNLYVNRRIWGNLCFYAIQYAVNDIGYSFGVNNLLIGLVEIATTLVVGKYVVDLPRKKTLIITYAIVPVLTSFLSLILFPNRHFYVLFSFLSPES